MNDALSPLTWSMFHELIRMLIREGLLRIPGAFNKGVHAFIKRCAPIITAVNTSGTSVAEEFVRSEVAQYFEALALLERARQERAAGSLPAMLVTETLTESEIDTLVMFIAGAPESLLALMTAPPATSSLDTPLPAAAVAVPGVCAVEGSSAAVPATTPTKRTWADVAGLFGPYKSCMEGLPVPEVKP